MKAVVYDGAGGLEVIAIRDVPVPVPTPHSLLIRVHATALNRGDILQRQGEYRVPDGQSSVPGVEIAGTVEGWGERVTGYRKGQRVFGVVEGGGFAELCLLDHEMANPVPEAWSFREAAATAESFLTANETLFTLGRLERGQRVLIHAGASSIGTTMIQMARHCGAIVFCTAGTPAKVAALQALGADAAIDYTSHDFVAEIAGLTGGQGVDLVMDFVGGAWLARNLSVLRPGGCLVLVGLLDGLEARLDLLLVIERRLRLEGSSLRLRPMQEKRQVNQRFRDRWLDVLCRDELRPVIHAEYPLADVATAQQEMEARRNVGKIVLLVR
jgi:putative PIG3 family NAD(P)H quinone oxidoreductase